MSSTRSAPSIEEGPPRKRVRKGTRSCWECKRRKVRCQLSSEDVPVCSGCLARGTTCLSQEFPEERENSSNNAVGERLGRVEHLLETLVAKIASFEEEEKAQKILTPQHSSQSDILTPYASNSSSNANQLPDNSPFLSLFDNTVLGSRRETNEQGYLSSSQTPISQAAESRAPSCIVPKHERIRQALLDLLPSQKDTDLIREESNSWLLIHALTAQADDALVMSTFDISLLQKAGPIRIARTLLYIAVCLQQLDGSLDQSRLNIPPSLEVRMERIITTVQSLVTSDDELVSCIEGLECLVLQGLFHINAGNPRRAWLLFRRALATGQLMGIHRDKTPSVPNDVAEMDMWYKIVTGDRYLCLILGLPAGSADPSFGPEETFENTSVRKHILFKRKLSNVARRVIERNQIDNTHAYAITQEIDEKLDSLATDVGPEYWHLPKYIARDKTLEAAISFENIMTQIWYFQLEALLHLPFMLRASIERRYDYSKFACLKASREILYRFLVLRGEDGKRIFCCNVVDFGALTATVTLFLGLLEADTSNNEAQRRSDRALIHTVLAAMEDVSQTRKDPIIKQSANVIKALLAFDATPSSSDVTLSRPSSHTTPNFKLTIPYFGTISIVRPQIQQPTPQITPEGSRTTTSNTSNSMTINTNVNTPPYLNIMGSQQQQQQHQKPILNNQQVPSNGTWPGLTFTPSLAGPGQNQNPTTVLMTQYNNFPGLDPNIDLGMPGEVDSMFFDGLLSTDLEGNWIF